MVALGVLCNWLFPITRQNFAVIRRYLDQRHSGADIPAEEKLQITTIIQKVHGAKIIQ